MMSKNFSFSPMPRILFGAGKSRQLAGIVSEFGRRILMVTGAGSLRESGSLDGICEKFRQASIDFQIVTVKGEPSPDFVDKVTAELRGQEIEVIVAVGGGSALDAGKAISAMIPQDGSVYDFLEGIGTKTHDGRKIPFVAVPTTAGTGGEATKNAVLSKTGPQGFKKSIRHENFVPDIALIDPELMISCPAGITAACGMDAFSQLLESYVSTGASPLTDALALSGLAYMKDAIIPVCTHKAGDISVRGAMAYGALISGITLANAGLGVIHGLASPLGAFFDIPHGVVCGTLLGVATRKNIETLKKADPQNLYLKKYARIGALLAGKPQESEGDLEVLCNGLIARLDEWVRTLKIPRLGDYGIAGSDVDKIVAATGLKNNPAPLGEAALSEILAERI
ncbi:MAG: iron-containing alcohol dehydrogenase [Pseudomonadota bacterium]